MKCIYCLQDKSLSSFTKPEHVLPRSFGLFENNLTLHKIVCDECNRYFGDTLEIALGRDSYEGRLRFEYGLRESTAFKSLGKKSRLTQIVQEGQFKGTHAYLEYSEDQGKIVVKPIPQVGFRKNEDSDYQYYLLEQLPTKEYFEQNGYDLKQPGSIIIIPSTDRETIEKSLLTKGLSFKARKDVDAETLDRDLLCRVEGIIDDTILRAVAKIAFNYLSYWQRSEFMLEGSFDPTRRFIRYGERPEFPLIKFRQEPILGDEPVEGKRRSGHLMTVDWAADKRSIVAQVSLFNWLTYSISLARDFAGERRPIQKGHFFDPYHKCILELGAKLHSSAEAIADTDS